MENLTEITNYLKKILGEEEGCEFAETHSPEITDPIKQEAKDKLQKLLDDNNIHYTYEVFMGGPKFVFTNGADVVCNTFTYGGDEGLWESYHFNSDDGDVTGWLSAEQVLEKVLKEVK